jgi:hypothetical protein
LQDIREKAFKVAGIKNPGIQKRNYSTPNLQNGDLFRPFLIEKRRTLASAKDKLKKVRK